MVSQNRQVNIMCIPVRCHTCGKILGTSDIHHSIQQVHKNKNNFNNVFKKFNIIRYCCKTTLMSYTTIIGELKKR